MKCPYCGYEVLNLEDHLEGFGSKDHALHWALHNKYLKEKEEQNERSRMDMGPEETKV